MTILHWGILLPFIAAIFVPFLYKWFKNIHTGWFVLTIPVFLFSVLLQKVIQPSEAEMIPQTVAWIPSLGIHFSVYADGLGLLFALLITGIGSLVVLYSVYYLSKHKEQLNSFYVYLLMFMGAMLGIVLSDNLIVLYLFWELTSLSSFLLIAYWSHREKSRYGAQKSMLITVFGGLSMLAGIILLYIMSGSFSIREIIVQLDVVTDHAFFIPAMLLILLGAFTKSAQFPFHIWLPDAMEAPTPVSAYLHSATMVKAGIYLVARLTPVFAGQAEWFWLVGGFGLMTLFWGSFNAVRQTDLKAILAFSTVSQLGLIMSLLGVGSAAVYFGYTSESQLYAKAIVAAIFHLINHATFKGCLFMVAGIVDHETGTRDIRRLGGLMSIMPITFTLSAIGAFSMAGLPPFNGFLSKEMFFTGMLNVLQLELFSVQAWGLLFPIIAWLASVFTFIYSMLIVFRTFTGPLQLEKLEKKPHEAPLGMLIAPTVLASLVVIIFFFPNILSYALIEPAVASILPSLGERFFVDISFWHGWNTELWMSLGVFAVGAFLYKFLRLWQGIYSLFPYKLSLNYLYDRGLPAMERSFLLFNRYHMTGYTRDYLLYIFTFLLVVIGGALLFLVPGDVTLENLTEIYIYEVLIALVMVVAAAAALWTNSRLTAIVSVGVVGYILSLFFVILRAPDLALTQLVVETVSVALFLLCFYHLPQLKKEMTKVRFKVANLLIALGVGLMMGLIALKAQSAETLESISKYFVDNSYKLAGGDNIVNVILVDFRGFDTMLEILVLGIAAIGIFALIKLRMAGGMHHEEK